VAMVASQGEEEAHEDSGSLYLGIAEAYLKDQ